MAGYYRNVREILTRPSEERSHSECLKLERWFRGHSKVLATLEEETLLDVIQHCEFVTRNRDDVIIQQGEKGHRFYIILRGAVAVYLYKDGGPDDLDLGEERLDVRQIDRQLLGFQVATLPEGVTFGEIALINTDCIRTASIICEETTDFVVITRDLYNRSVSKVIAREYAEKVKFIESLSLFSSWSPRLKKQMAVSLRKETLNFDSVLVKQGDPASDLYFIVKGEVKLMLDVESHYNQYEKLFGRCSDLMDEYKSKSSRDGSIPQKLLPQLEKINRMNHASMMQSAGAGHEQLHVPMSWSPSAIRKMNLKMNHKKVNLNLCFLGQKQIIGDVEFLLGLDTFHHTATCSRETTIMVLHKAHFDRLFRKRSPRTLVEMSKMMETQLTLRCLKPNILEAAPILRVFLYRLQEINGERKRGDEKSFLHTLRHLSTNFEIDAASRLPQAPQSRTLVSQSPTIDRHLCDTPDLAHAHHVPVASAAASRTSSDASRYQRSKTILIPKVEA